MKYRNAANPELAAAMRELRRSNAATRHKDRHALAKKGVTKGGRSGWRTTRTGDWP